jgi:hypothetical protein
VRADPQYHDDARGNEEDGKTGKQGARANRIARRLECALDRAAKTRDAKPLIGEGLKHAHRAN